MVVEEVRNFHYYLVNLSKNNYYNYFRDIKNSGGFNGIRTHDLCDAVAMLCQLNYEATHLGAGHVLHTSSSWGPSMPYGVACLMPRWLSIRLLCRRSWDQNPGRGCRDGAVVRALVSYHCGPSSIPRLGVICGLSLLVLYSAPRGFLWVLRFPLSSKTNT